MFFDIKSLNHILKIKKHLTFYFVLRQLISQKILIKVEKNKYLLENSKINDFTLSNFLYSPSYISFNSALNYYGILPQFSYEITASTTKKQKLKNLMIKYFHIFILKKNYSGNIKK